jgi:hypothetical protein
MKKVLIGSSIFVALGVSSLVYAGCPYANPKSPFERCVNNGVRNGESESVANRSCLNSSSDTPDNKPNDHPEDSDCDGKNDKTGEPTE